MRAGLGLGVDSCDAVRGQVHIISMAGVASSDELSAADLPEVMRRQQDTMRYGIRESNSNSRSDLIVIRQDFTQRYNQLRDMSTESTEGSTDQKGALNCHHSPLSHNPSPPPPLAHLGVGPEAHVVVMAVESKVRCVVRVDDGRNGTVERSVRSAIRTRDQRVVAHQEAPTEALPCVVQCSIEEGCLRSTGVAGGAVDGLWGVVGGRGLEVLGDEAGGIVGCDGDWQAGGCLPLKGPAETYKTFQTTARC